MKKLTVKPKFVVPQDLFPRRPKLGVPICFVSELRELVKQVASVLDFVDGLELEDMKPILSQSLFDVLRIRVACAKAELIKLCGENGRKA